MSRVLILSKTRMQENRVCVGGVDLDNRCSIRLLNHDGYHETIDECPYELLTIWEIEYNRTNRRPEPHLEDVSVVLRNVTSRCVKPKELLKLPSYNLHLYRSRLLDVFDEKLNYTDSGSLFINQEKGVPNFSTCFWLCDKPLRKNRYSTPERIKYDYHSDDGRWFHITYVGLEDIPDVIPQGTLIRLSLAHWWHPEGQEEDRCFLQLSGIYNVSE